MFQVEILLCCIRKKSFLILSKPSLSFQWHLVVESYPPCDIFVLYMTHVFVGKLKLKHQTRSGLVCWLHGKICSVIMHSKFKVCVKISGAMSIQVPVLWICTSSSYTCMYDIIQRRCSLILSIIKRVTTSLLHFRIQVLQSHLCLQTEWISDHIGIF